MLAEFKLDDPKASTILLDYSTGIHAAIRHLADLGHRAIGFLAGPYSLHSAITRENDFRAAMQPPGCLIQKKWIIECDHTLKGGVAGFEQLRKLAARPTAIVCSNDMTAIGVLRAAYMAGLRVPQDLSVIGLDDVDFAEYTLPPLTTIRLSRTDLAHAAFEALRMQAEDPDNPKMQREFLVSTSLVVRGSTAPPPPPVRHEFSSSGHYLRGRFVNSRISPAEARPAHLTLRCAGQPNARFQRLTTLPVWKNYLVHFASKSSRSHRSCVEFMKPCMHLVMNSQSILLVKEPRRAVDRVLESYEDSGRAQSYCAWHR